MEAETEWCDLVSVRTAGRLLGHEILPDYSPRLVWSLWFWPSGCVTIHEPSCDRDAELA